ncbi:MAG: PEP-CTERM sorting domain-containing protein [Phycisphaerae bacterium]|nr:PEP-CTERM sorting domain-containing protein [Phycisphaerae bacterium]
MERNEVMRIRHRVLFALVAFTVAMPISSVLAGGYKALLVGCDDWAGDVDPMKTAMLNWDTVYWEADNIITMKNPMGQDVLNEISNIKITDPDFFFFAYTGHGYGCTFPNDDSYYDGNPESGPALNGTDEWLCTNNGDWISDDALTAALMGFNNKLVLLDSCYSGGFWNDGSNEGDLENLLGGTCLYAACSERFTSPINSPLWYNCEYGCSTGTASYGDSVITVQDWYDYSKTATPSYIFYNLSAILTVPVFATPEPGTVMLLGMGGLVLLRQRRG